MARGRRTIASAGCLGAAVLLFVHTGIRDPLWSMVVMGLASLCNDLVLPSYCRGAVSGQRTRLWRFLCTESCAGV